jgi:hypothetical protein
MSAYNEFIDCLIRLLKFNTMKKSMLLGSIFTLALSPAFLNAQEIKLPTVVINVSQDKVPLKVKEAVLNDFGGDHKPITWVTTHSIFSTYDWEQSTNVDNLDVYSYAIHSQTSNGCTLDAAYTPDGKRINSRESLRNFRPAQSILNTLQNSEYKDWAINKDFLVRKVSSNGSEKERYALLMKKGNQKKTILLDSNGKILANQRGEHLELADANF